MPSRRVTSGLASTSTQTGSKQAVIKATASSLASVVRSSVVLAELQLAVKMASTGRWLISEARLAVAISACHATAAEADAAYADDRVTRATVASRWQIRDGIGIGITMQVEGITPASEDIWHDHQIRMSCHRGCRPKGRALPSGFKSERCIGRNGHRNRIEKASGWDLA
jgi:hypothetical protein